MPTTTPTPAKVDYPLLARGDKPVNVTETARRYPWQAFKTATGAYNLIARDNWADIDEVEALVVEQEPTSGYYVVYFLYTAPTVQRRAANFAETGAF